VYNIEWNRSEECDTTSMRGEYPFLYKD
jgi:hypothetical protein